MQLGRPNEREESRRIDFVHNAFGDNLNIVAELLEKVGNAALDARHSAKDARLVRRIFAQGGGKPSRMGGRIGVRKSFFQQYFSSRRSETQGGTRMGVNKPIEKGQQPLNPNGASANRPSTRVRTFLIAPPPFLPIAVRTRQPLQGVRLLQCRKYRMVRRTTLTVRSDRVEKKGLQSGENRAATVRGGQNNRSLTVAALLLNRDSESYRRLFLRSHQLRHFACASAIFSLSALAAGPKSPGRG